MSDLSDSSSSRLSDGWAVVSAQGELEDSDADSNTSSIAVVEQETESKLDEKPDHHDPASQGTSMECTELEQLMKKADAAAAAVGEMGRSEPVASESVTTPVGATAHRLSVLSPTAQEPSGAGWLRRESTGEEEARTKSISAQTSPERVSQTEEASHADRASQTERASQTDRASPVLSDRRLSLSSLWSFSSKSSSADTSGSEVSSIASTDTDKRGYGSSSETDTDTEPEFVCLETETSSNSAESAEGSMSRSEVKARTSSRPSVGSEFKFLSGSDDFVQSVSTDLSSHPPTVPPLAVHHHHQQQQQQPSYPQASTSPELFSSEEQEPSSDLPREQAFPVGEVVESGEAVSSGLQDLQPSQRGERCVTSGDAVTHQGAAHRHPHLSSEEADENDVVSPPVDSLHHQDLFAEEVHAMVTEPKSVGHPSVPSIKRWLSGHLGLVLGILLTVLLAFCLGHWLGMTRGQSRQLETQLSHMEELRLARDEHRQCMSQRHHTQQQADAAFERERKAHQETVAELQNKHQQLAERLKAAQQQMEQLLTARNEHPQGSAEDTSRRGKWSTWKTAAHRERGKRKRPGTDSEESTFPKQNVHNQEREDMLHHLYFSMREEREIEMNTSSYLHYLTRGMNMSAFLQYLKQYWNASMNWTEGMADRSAWVSGLSRLQESVVQTVPSVWREVSSTLSHFYHVFAGAISQPAQSQHSEGDATENRKDGKKDNRDWTEDEDDEEVYVEDVEENDNDWEGKREEENEYVEMDDFDHERKEYNKKSKTEDDTYSHKHRKKWSGIMNKLLKKTQKALSRVGNRLQKTWHKVKNTSWKLWSKNSGISRIADRVKNSINKFSSKLQKKAERWFRRHPKEKEDSEGFHRHAKEGTHAHSDQNGKKSGHKYDETQGAMSDKHHKNGKNAGKSNKSVEEGNNKHRPDKHSRDRKREGKLDNASVGEMKEGMSPEVDNRKEQGNSDKLVKDEKGGRSDKMGKDQKKAENPNRLGVDEKNEEYIDKTYKGGKNDRKSHKLGKNEKNEENSNKLAKNDKKGRADNLNKEDRQFDKVSENVKEERSDKLAENSAKKERSDAVNKIRKEGSDRSANREKKRAKSGKSSQKEGRRKKKDKSGSEYPQDADEQDQMQEAKFDKNHLESLDDNHKGKFEAHNLKETQHMKERGHGKESASKASKPHHTMSGKARTKFRLQSRFQELFSKVGSMTKEAFEGWSGKEVSKMVADLVIVAELYNDNLDLGLPISGSQWLHCQRVFWVSAASDHVHYEPTQSCLQFLAPWQEGLLEEGAESLSSEKIQEDTSEMNGEGWNSLKHSDHTDTGDSDGSVGSEDDFGDDCHVYSDMCDDDEECDDSSDDEVHLPEGQREGYEDTNTPSDSQPTQAWYIHRAKGRSNLRSEDHKADWMFERAMERDEARRQEHAADWVFERATDRDASRQKKGEDDQDGRKQKPESQYAHHSKEKYYESSEGKHGHHGKKRIQT